MTYLHCTSRWQSYGLISLLVMVLSQVGSIQAGEQQQSSPQMSPQLAALSPEGQRQFSQLTPQLQAMVVSFVGVERDPNMDAEFQHMMYWMGGYRRCNITRGHWNVSVLGMMVMLEKAYQQFGPLTPNLESLLMLAASPRDSEVKPGQVASADIILHCRKQQPVAIMEWLMPELYSFRGKHNSRTVSR